MTTFFAGDALYGDNFGQDQIDLWFADEAEAYATLDVDPDHTYGYHDLNVRHGFRYLPAPTTLDHVLGFGALYGEELEPILPRVRRITIVEASDAFVRNSIGGVPATYVKPRPSGQLDLPSASVDLITCFSVLHHIPNVSAVMRELARVLTPGGFMLLREPIVSLGDWRQPRRGLTTHERGIPLGILSSIVSACELGVLRESLCDFPLTSRLFGWLPDHPYNYGFVTRVDAAFSRVFAWNVNYHPRNTLQRFRPRSAAFVLRKGA